jgi:hypothetical protein
MTAWHHEDDDCWVADCESCDVPMVVWKQHGTEPPAATVDRMLEVLDGVALARYGEGRYSLDRVMRQIPDHFHAHARDLTRWLR